MLVWAWQLNRLKPKSTDSMSRSLLGQNPAPAGRAYFRGHEALEALAACRRPPSRQLRRTRAAEPSHHRPVPRGHVGIMIAVSDGTATAPQALA